MTPWLIAALSLASVPFLVAGMAFTFAAVFDLLDLARPRAERIHALRSLSKAVAGTGRNG